MARLLLLSTYELGEQPLGIAIPAMGLTHAGHELVATDLAVESWPEQHLGEVDGVVCSVPMHTALRLAVAAVDRIRVERPELPIALIGLYAPVARSLGLLRPSDLATDGVDDSELLVWADGLGRRSLRVATAPSELPRRDLLPSLEHYAHLEQDGVELLVGAVEASVGCNYRCRHCPVPLVYNGRSRAVDVDAVLADIGQLVDLGASHIHFADPDFLNRPQHARRVALAMATQHPGLSFDITARVSHLLRNRELLPELAEAGLAFVISAFESTSDVVLDRLDKGHTSADLARAVGALREAGVEPRPSLLPFTPWTERSDLVELLDFVAEHDLVWNIDAVQYSIRLLLPPSSPFVEEPDEQVRQALVGYDADELGYQWRSEDSLLDELQSEIAALVERAEAARASAEVAYGEIRELVFDAFGAQDPGAPEACCAGRGDGPSRPKLSEAWFCCAEPTREQFARLGRSAIEPCSDACAEPVALHLPVRRAGH